MYWASKLKRKLSFGRKAILPQEFSGSTGKERILEILKNNPAINGSQSIASQILSAGTTVYFRKGDKIIQEGAQDNDVYFILSGKVDIVFKSQKGSIREAPNQIGEMAAIDLGKPRSASVVARTDEVAAIKVPGTTFHKIWTRNPKFKQFLQIEMLARHRERTVAGTIARENNSIIWFGISVVTGLAVGLIALFLLIPADWTCSAQSLLSFGSGLAAFLFTLLHNPAFFWRRTLKLVLLAMIGTFILDSYIFIELTQGIGSLQVGIGSAEGETSWRTIASYLVVIALCAYMDRTANRD